MLVGRDQLAVVHAAREGARAAAVAADPDGEAASAAIAASGLDRLAPRPSTSSRRRPGHRRRCATASPTDVPLVGGAHRRRHRHRHRHHAGRAVTQPSTVTAQDGAQQRQRAGLVERLVAVAALRRLHAARAPPLARAALDHRQRRRQVPGDRRRSRARRCPRRRGSRRRSRSSGRPVSAWNGVDTPPTSQRSQIVNSGRMPMPACSTACSVPGHLLGAETGPGERRCSSTVYQNARVTGGTAAGRAPRGRAPRALRRVAALVADHLGGDLDAPRSRPARPTVLMSSALEDRDRASRCGPGCTRRRRRARRSAARSSRSSCQHPVLLALVEVDRARVDLLEGPAARRPCRRAGPSRLDDAELVGRARAQADAPAPACPGRSSRPAPSRSRSRSSSTSWRTPSSRSSPHHARRRA